MVFCNHGSLNVNYVLPVLEFPPYGLKITDSGDLFLTERNMLEFLMKLGREATREVFQGIGTGYEGAVVNKGGRKYRFIGYRGTSLHGLFGMIDYRRAYYFSDQKGGGGYFPLDEKLGIDKRHTPGCQYFLSSFTGREAYEKSLERFHEIFRPDCTELISLRKSLDMDAELGERLQELRQQEIAQVFEGKQTVDKENPIQGLMAVSADATKLRERGEVVRTADGKKSYPSIWRDVKIGAVSEVGWDDKRQEAFCSSSSYVSGIEHADEFLRRLTVELQRRAKDPKTQQMAFLADGAKWIWDRFADIAPPSATFILDFYHACEHVSELCKRLHGEQTREYWKHFKRWKTTLFAGRVQKFLHELCQIRDTASYRAHRDFIQGEINYFIENKNRMRYDVYRARRLPIGSGSIVMRTHGVITLFFRCRQDAASSFESALQGGSLPRKAGCKVA
jgi:hypothetical protein